MLKRGSENTGMHSRDTVWCYIIPNVGQNSDPPASKSVIRAFR